MSAKKFFKKLLRYTLCLAAGLAAFAACGYTDYRLWPLDLPASAHPRVPMTAVANQQLVLPFTPGVPVAEVASFNDQLEAFLRFEYLRGREARAGHDTSHMLLTAVNTKKAPHYKIFIVTNNDLLAAISQLADLEGRNLIAHYELETWSEKELSYYQQESHTFDVAYDLPTEQKLETINSSRMLPALAQFLIFKSQTDNRVVDGSQDAPRPLTREQATELASDILDVAHFYDLPLDYFMGVGAMENDYMDVNGDLTHAVWKKRAQRGDIVLRRTRKRVMVSDYAMGAYNGGVRTPNPDYASGVKNVADYARRILEHASAQDDPNTNAKSADKPQPTTPCLSPSPAPPNAPGTNNCATPGARNLSADDAQNPSPQPKPPYRRDD